ncbi:MAG TPA: hypothetical protein VGD59_10055 [Acidisarcina sp.]
MDDRALSRFAIIAVGGFGEAVAKDFLARNSGAVQIAATDLALGSLPLNVQALALAAGNPSIAVADTLDNIARTLRVSLLALTADAHGVVIAHYNWEEPGACPVCHAYRTLANSHAPEGEALLRQYFAEHPDDCPAGFLQPFVLMGSEWLTQGCIQSAYGVNRGMTRRCSFEAAEINEEAILPVNHCPRCSAPEPHPDRMRQELAYLWQSSPDVERESH